MPCGARRAWASLTHIWFRADTRMATLASITSGWAWAICLAFPGDTLARPTYKIMASVGPEGAWITAFIVMSSLQSWRFWCRLTTSKSYVIESAIKTLATAMWTYIAYACMLAQYPPAAAVADTCVVALLTWWDFLRWDQNGHYVREASHDAA